MSSLAEPNSNSNDKRIRVLFMHGLEGGVNTSRKCKILEKHYTVNMPNMARLISGHFKLRSHSYLVWLLLTLVFFVVILIGWTFVNMIRNTDTKNVLLFLASAAASFLGILTLLRYIFDRLMDQCCKLQAQAIAEFQPDVIVGSSFGGAVAVHCLLRKIWRGPTLLLAPAQGKLFNLTLRNFIKKYARELRELDSQIPITVVHGTQDTVVSITGSEELVQCINAHRSPPHVAKYIVVEDLHPLNRYFTNKVAKQLVQALLHSGAV